MRTLGQNNLSIAILGPGAIGGFLAALFCNKGFRVICVSSDASFDLLSAEGISFESASLGSFTVRPSIVKLLKDRPDILFITTKATVLNDALKRIERNFTEDAIIIPLLNGIEHMAVIRAAYGGSVVAAAIGNIEVKRNSLNYIVHTTPSISPKVELASDREAAADELRMLVDLFSVIGIEARILKSEAEVLWTKLVRLNAIACAGSAANQPLGFIRMDKLWRSYLESCVQEATAVARAEGANIDPDAVMAQIDGLPAGLVTSMQRDIMAGKLSELDAIAGAVIRKGISCGIPCPTIEALVKKINEGL